ncbi:SH3 domain-containing protein [Phenylobacterium sp.]|uniref:SH3 domain-containing protein n=1 Tax=Phenylobacterium sp. TaxID=1871053 RepID=UPI0025DF398C|nr:SH3 domain-containing protein [Phenylobacterium sp.]
MAIAFGILAVLAMLVTFGLQKAHHDQTGVWGPSRAQMRYIRRKARKSGISEHDAYEAWLARNEQALVATPAPALANAPTAEGPKRRGGCLGALLLVLAVVAALAVIGTVAGRPGLRSATVDRARVNCRAEAAAGAKIVMTFSRGDPVRVVEESGGWSKVIAGDVGYGVNSSRPLGTRETERPLLDPKPMSAYGASRKEDADFPGALETSPYCRDWVPSPIGRLWRTSQAAARLGWTTSRAWSSAHSRAKSATVSQPGSIQVQCERPSKILSSVTEGARFCFA